VTAALTYSQLTKMIMDRTGIQQDDQRSDKWSRADEEQPEGQQSSGQRLVGDGKDARSVPKCAIKRQAIVCSSRTQHCSHCMAD
jgi:hypothetical protein